LKEKFASFVLCSNGFLVVIHTFGFLADDAQVSDTAIVSSSTAATDVSLIIVLGNKQQQFARRHFPEMES
tara:strand:+ start:18 stop:227 length:210 start_codon:yes stop_codon:yes gene_type:complete